MYAAYALSSIMSPTSSLMDMRAAGAIPALISVLNTSKVNLALHCSCSCTAQTGLSTIRGRLGAVGLLPPCGAPRLHSRACQVTLPHLGNLLSPLSSTSRNPDTVPSCCHCMSSRGLSCKLHCCALFFRKLIDSLL